MNSFRILTLMTLLMVSFSVSAETVGENIDKYIATAKTQMEVLDKKLEKYGDKVEKMSDESKVEAKKTYAELKKDKRELQVKLDSLKGRAENEWDSFKKSFKKTYSNIESRVEKAIQ